LSLSTLPLEPWEWWFGDGIYKSRNHIQAKYTRDDGGVLTDYQIYINTGTDV
jgi:hypothetical protein